MNAKQEAMLKKAKRGAQMLREHHAKRASKVAANAADAGKSTPTTRK